MRGAIFLVLMLLFGLGPTRVHAEPTARTKQAKATDQILIASLRYCFPRFDPERTRSYLCSINPRLGSGPLLNYYLKTKHIKRIATKNAPSTSNRPKQWVYVSIENVTMLNERQASASAYMSYGASNSEVFTEAEATIHLDRIHGRWIVNRHESRVQVGD